MRILIRSIGSSICKSAQCRTARQRFGLRQPPGALSPDRVTSKAPEDWRSPKPGEPSAASWKESFRFRPRPCPRPSSSFSCPLETLSISKDEDEDDSGSWKILFYVVAIVLTSASALQAAPAGLSEAVPVNQPPRIKPDYKDVVIT